MRLRSESELRQGLTKGLRAHHVIATPIESGTTGLGIPDLYIRTTKVSAWAELKHIRQPFTYPFVVPFRPGQHAWLTQHHRLGGVSLLIMSTPTDIFVFKNKHIHEAYDKNMYNFISFSFVNFNVLEFIEWLDASR